VRAAAARRRDARSASRWAQHELARASVPSVPFQPSELIKVALVIWLGLIVHEEAGPARRLRAGHILRSSSSAAGRSASCCLGGDTGHRRWSWAGCCMGALFLIGVRLRLPAAGRAPRTASSS
jgi:cell division protein FtsW (lipid II flippase)